MSLHNKLLLLVVVFAYTSWHLVHTACNVCQNNGVACINLTSFHFCFDSNEPFKEQTFTCTNGLVCTDLPSICFQSSTLPASCGDISSCGKCNSRQVFACTSRTTFNLCFGATIPTDVNGTCPAGTTCDASSPNICVREVTQTSIICDLDLNQQFLLQ